MTDPCVRCKKKYFHADRNCNTCSICEEIEDYKEFMNITKGILFGHEQEAQRDAESIKPR